MTSLETKGLGLQEVIGYTFKDQELLIKALSHASYVNERKLNRTESYERLEFLGDAVLELVTSTMLFKAQDTMTEGQMSKTRASLVCEEALSLCARKIQLGSYILLGHGERSNNGADRPSILSDVLEAVIGAIYLDGGFERAGMFIREFILDEDSMQHGFVDYKTRLQELVQGTTGPDAIEYVLTDASGPEHDRIYSVALFVNGEQMGTGSGHNKRAAEQEAAACALTKLK